MSINKRIIHGNWGYAVIKDDAIWIPAIEGDMKIILKKLHEMTGMNRIIFSAVLNPGSFKKHLKNIVKEWDAWFEEAQDYSHCIEIKYEPIGGKNDNKRKRA